MSNKTINNLLEDFTDDIETTDIQLSDESDMLKAALQKLQGAQQSPEEFIARAIAEHKTIKVQNKEQLKDLIETAVKMYGDNVDLSFVDTSMVTDMSSLFMNSTFNGNISKWDVSNVVNMQGMFAGSIFNGNISKWNVKNVTNMRAMFAQSFFNKDISKWNVKNVTNMANMFEDSIFNQDISKWNVSKVVCMSGMFKNASFDGDISNWDVSNVLDFTYMFFHSSFGKDKDLSRWKINRKSRRNMMVNIGF